MYRVIPVNMSNAGKGGLFTNDAPTENPALNNQFLVVDNGTLKLLTFYESATGKFVVHVTINQQLPTRYVHSGLFLVKNEESLTIYACSNLQKVIDKRGDTIEEGNDSSEEDGDGGSDDLYGGSYGDSYVEEEGLEIFRVELHKMIYRIVWSLQLS